MTDFSQPQPPTGFAPPPQATLGVIDATGMGWRLMMADFWNLWLVALVAWLVSVGVGMVSCLMFATCVLACAAPVVGFFVEPPILAGFFRAVSRRIDGMAVQVDDLFAAFRQCYWPAVLAGLPLMLIDAASGLAGNLGRPVGDMMAGLSRSGDVDEAAAIAIIVGVGVLVLLVGLALFVLRMFFGFALLAVWDTPKDGVAAIKESMRLVWAHFWSVLGFTLLFAVLWLAATLAGVLMLIVGLLFTLPAVAVWEKATMVYLYRTWTGRPLSAAVADPFSPPPDDGPIMPTSIESPVS
jgi:hypothetical protein